MARVNHHKQSISKEIARQHQLAKAEKEALIRLKACHFAVFEGAIPAIKSTLSSEAYEEVKKAILIGGMASASKPFHRKDRMPSTELKQAVASLMKKNQPQYPDLKRRYQAIWGSELRRQYGGAENAARGALYSQLRVNKYREHVGIDSRSQRSASNMLSAGGNDEIKNSVAE